MFFAWYSRGNILIEMEGLCGAAEAYDEAFACMKNSALERLGAFFGTRGPFFGIFTPPAIGTF